MKIRWHTPTTQFFLVFLIVTGLCVFLPLGYETNDDYMMELIYSGYFTGKPEYGSLFNHILLSKTLQLLYQVDTSINWYGIIHLGVLIMATLSLAWHCSHSSDKASNQMVLLIMLGAFSCFIVRMNFATVSFLSGFIGLYILFDQGKASALKILNAVVLILFSLVIRPHFFLFAGIILFPLMAYRLRSNFARTTQLAFFVIILYALLSITNMVAYRYDTTWSGSYKTYSHLIYLLDNPSFNLYYLKPHQAQIHWTDNDYFLFKNFFFELPGKLDLETLKYLKQIIPRDTHDFNELLPALANNIPPLFFLLLALSLFHSYSAYGTEQLLINLLYIVVLILFLKYLSGNKTILKDRFMNCLYFGVLANSFISYSPRRKKGIWSGAFGLVFLLSLTALIIRHSEKQRQYSEDANKLQSHLNRQYHGKSVFDFYCHYPIFGFKSYVSSTSQLNGITMLPMGWLVMTPILESYYKHKRIKPLTEQMLLPETLHLIPKECIGNYKELLGNYYMQYFNLKITFNDLEQIKCTRQTWQLIEVSGKMKSVSNQINEP